MIVVDTLRADHLSLYGHTRDTSSNLDELATSSVVMESAYANAPWTKPSVASLFTGLLPSRHRVRIESTGNHLAPSLTTLPELLQRAGYATAGFTENPHISRSTRFDQGFELLEHSEGWRGNSSWVVENASAWLAARPRGRPFFLYLHFLDPHDPYQPRGRRDFQAGVSTEKPVVKAGKAVRLMDGARLREDVTPGDVAYLEALYDREITRSTPSCDACSISSRRRRSWTRRCWW